MVRACRRSTYLQLLIQTASELCQDQVDLLAHRDISLASVENHPPLLDQIADFRPVDLLVATWWYPASITPTALYGPTSTIQDLTPTFTYCSPSKIFSMDFPDSVDVSGTILGFRAAFSAAETC